jgi:two-component system, sensor histidine kinase LadS
MIRRPGKRLGGKEIEWQNTRGLRTIGRFAILLLLFLFVFGHCHLAAFAASRPMQLADTSAHDLSGHLEYYGDSSGKLTFAEIRSHGGPEFSQLEGSLNDGYRHKAVWLRFTLLRTSKFPSVAYLRLYPPHIDHVTAYIQSTLNVGQLPTYKEINTGWHVAAVDRPLLNPNLVIPVSLPLDKPVTVYLRIQSDGPINLGGKIHSFDDLETKTYFDALSQGLFIGLILAIALFNLIFFSRIRDMLFLYFSFYSVMVGGSYLAKTGIPALLFFPRYSILGDYLECICFCGEILMLSLIIIRLFNTGNPKNRPNTIPIHWYLIFTSVLAGIGVFSIPFGMYRAFALLTTANGLILFLVILWLSFYNRVAVSKDGVLYLAIVNIVNIAYLLSYLGEPGWIPLTLSDGNYEVGIMINMIISPVIIMRHLRTAENKVIELYRTSEQKAVALAKDMTSELRKNEAALNLALESERLIVNKKSRFLSLLSHEYRTPLTIILSSLDLLESDSETSANLVDRIPKMRRAVDRLVNVMDVALERSRLSDSHDTSEISNFKLSSLIDVLLSDFHALFPQRTIISTVKIGVIEIMGNFQLLNTAVFTILEHAVKFSKSGSSIELSCLDGEHGALITIASQGDSIHPANVEGMFEKHSQERESKSRIDGAGAGLLLVRGIINAHDGSITRESVASKMVVTIRLPVAGSGKSLHEQFSENQVSACET